MTGLDRSAAAAAKPPLVPVPVSSLTETVLIETGERIARRTENMGLAHWFWGEGIALLGLIRFADAAGVPLPPTVARFVDDNLAAGVALEHVNNLAPGAACVRLLADTGSPRYANLCDSLLDWLLPASAQAGVTVAENGAIEHWPGGVWADTVCMAGLFLMHYGRHTGRQDLLVAAGRQIVAHAEILVDPATGLCAHGSHRGETLWWFWGRANAWLALASVEFLEAVDAGAYGENELTNLAATVRGLLTRQLTTLASCQPDHGVWDVLVDGQPENNGIPETSAAAGIAAAMLRAARQGIDPDTLRRSAWRALAGIHAYVAEDGTLTRTSAGTVLQLVPFGYSVIRDDLIQPWGQGLALHAYAAALTDLTTPA